jgi:competence protein ComEA
MKKILSIMVSVAVIVVLTGIAASAERTTGSDLMNKVDKQENVVEQKEKAKDVLKKKDKAKKSYKKKRKFAAESLNINTASKEDLEALPGIDSKKAQAIIDGRPYSKKESLMKVKGIKEGTYQKIKDYISI